MAKFAAEMYKRQGVWRTVLAGANNVISFSDEHNNRHMGKSETRE